MTSTSTWTWYQAAIGRVYSPGVLTRADVTITHRIFHPDGTNSIVIEYTKTDCVGQFQITVGQGEIAYPSMGKWVLQGGAYVLDTPYQGRDGCCTGASGPHPLPPDQHYNLSDFTMVSQNNNAAVCYAVIGGVPKSAAGVKVTITDGCGHNFTGTTDINGTIMLDSAPGVSAFSHILFDWSTVQSATINFCPPSGSFTGGVSGLLAISRRVFPSIDPLLYTDCLCGGPDTAGGTRLAGPNLALDVTGLFNAGNNAATNPSNLHKKTPGIYGRFAATNGGVQFWRSNTGVPPFDLSASQITTNSADSDPHGVYDTRLQRLICYFSRSGAPSGAYSDDNGKTWTSGGAAPGTFPRVAVDTHTGETLTAGYAGGNILTQYQSQGMASASSSVAIVDETGAAIITENDSFDICRDTSAGVWLGIWRVSGSGACSVWRSSDTGRSWKKQYDCLTGCSRPRMAIDSYTSELLLTGYLAGHLKGVYQSPGSMSASAAFTLVDASGNALAVQDTTFDISKDETGRSGRWVGAFLIAGDTAPSEWVSGNVMGGSWAKV